MPERLMWHINRVTVVRWSDGGGCAHVLTRSERVSGVYCVACEDAAQLKGEE